MIDVITDEGDVETPDVGVVELDELDQQLVGQLVDRARSQGLRLTGEDGLLAQGLAPAKHSPRTPVISPQLAHRFQRNLYHRKPTSPASWDV